MTSYPENTLLAIQSALDLNLSHIEIDIQLCKDLVPMVIHDDCLLRTTGVDKKIGKLSTEEINRYLVKHSSLSIDNAESVRIPTLEAVVEKLNNHPGVTLFVEIKRQSIETFGLKIVVDAVLKVLKQAGFSIVIISFVAEVILYLKTHTQYAVGWVLREYNQVHQQQAQLLQPEYLFCNINKIEKASSLWRGAWQWVLYDVRDPQVASELLTQGIPLIETGDIVKLANAKQFQ
jgi:glycerophosphoryl diester phosphodiesterase